MKPNKILKASLSKERSQPFLYIEMETYDIVGLNDVFKIDLEDQIRHFKVKEVSSSSNQPFDRVILYEIGRFKPIAEMENFDLRILFQIDVKLENDPETLKRIERESLIVKINFSI